MMPSRPKKKVKMSKNIPELSKVNETTNQTVNAAENRSLSDSSTVKLESSNNTQLEDIPSTSAFKTNPCDVISYSDFLPKENHQRITSTTLINYDLTSDQFDSVANLKYVKSETELIDYESDEKISESKSFKVRRRNVNIENWKSNKSKKLRSQCLPYITKTGLKPAKVPKRVDCTNCRFKCTQNFTQDDRISLCKAYWELNNYERQMDYILQNVRTEAPKRRKVGAKKQRVMSKQYYFTNSNGALRVCAQFFEKTLCISNGPITTALAHTNEDFTFSGLDNRGYKTPGNATSKENIQLVKQHIESFPHSARKTSDRRYLDPTLSILKMYSLYLDFCKEKNVLPIRSHIYRKIFCTEYNLAFFTPKKDQCSTSKIHF